MKSVCCAVVLLCFLAASAWAAEVQVEQLARSTSSWNGVSLPDYSEEETEVTVLRITVPPNTSLPMHIHPVINVAYMLEGELTVVADNGDRKVIRQGDPLIELVNERHYGINEGDQPVELVVVYVGREGQPITVKE